MSKLIFIGLFNAALKDDGFVPKEINNAHFHAKCKLEERNVPYEKPQKDGRVNKIEGYTCLDHDVLVCRCGWEVGWHDGEDSKALMRDFKKLAYKKRGLKLKILYGIS